MNGVSEITCEAPATPAVLRHLMRGVWLQALRRNELRVMAVLMTVYVLGALVLRIVGIDSAQTARFIAGLGLQLGSLLAALLVIVTGARQIPEELELRTIYPVLAKPVERWQLLLGKALPTWLTGVAALLLFTLATRVIVPGLPYQQSAVLAEALLLKAAGLAMMTALVICLSLYLPVAVNALVCGGYHLAGGMLLNMLDQALGGGAAARAACGLLPDFRLFEQFMRYTDGGAPLPGMMLGGLLLYAVLWTAITGGVCAARFRRLPL